MLQGIIMRKPEDSDGEHFLSLLSNKFLLYYNSQLQRQKEK